MGYRHYHPKCLQLHQYCQYHITQAVGCRRTRINIMLVRATVLMQVAALLSTTSHKYIAESSYPTHTRGCMGIVAAYIKIWWHQ